MINTGEFEVDKLEEIKFVPNAFDVLKLPQADKNLLKAVVGQTKSGLVSMDDLVAKKGQLKVSRQRLTLTAS